MNHAEKSSASLPHGTQVREILQRINNKIRRRRKELERRRSAEEELEQIIAAPKSKDDNWTWIGALAGLARLYAEKEQWSAAAKRYQQLLRKEHKRLPEVRVGLEKVVNGLQAEGDRLLKEGRPREAMQQFTQALGLVHESLPDDKKRQADLHSRLGYTQFELQDIADTRSHFVKAIQLYRESDPVISRVRRLTVELSGGSFAGGMVGDVCRSLLRDPAHYWALEDEWKAFENDVTTNERLRRDLAAARKALANYLDELYKLSGQVGEQPLIPVVTPIVLEIGHGLIPEDTSTETWSLFKTYIPEMRKRIQDGMGVQVPGVRVGTGSV